MHEVERFRRVEEIFHEAVLQPAGPARARLLDSRCNGDAELRSELESLLRFDELRCDEEPGITAATEGSASPATPELPTFGIFQAERIVGRGGASVVYQARRTDGRFDQIVAVKVLWPNLLNNDVVRQSFLREPRILAGLRHAAITQVLDGGVDSSSGSAYLVMEYVDGLPLDEYCRVNRFSLRRRVDLFLAVCDAVAYAHRNLVVHLDLKPANILITTEGQPKLLDFGTAKLLAGLESSVTQQFATPRFASPEQLRGDRAGIASDVFSLGVILFELLSGSWPYGDPSSQLIQLQRALEKTQPRSLSEAAKADHAERCGLIHSRLRAELRGDLEAIAARALDEDPEHRYGSVDEFAGDLRRYLKGEPVLARRQTSWYRARRFVARHRIAVMTAAVAFTGLLGMSVYSYLEYKEARREATVSLMANLTLEKLISEAARYTPGQTTTLQDIVRESEAMLASGAPLDPSVSSALRRSIATVALGNAETVEGIRQLRAAVEDARRAGDRIEEGLSLGRLSGMLVQTGPVDEAERSARTALKLAGPGLVGDSIRTAADGALIYLAAYGSQVPAADTDERIREYVSIARSHPALFPLTPSMYNSFAQIRFKQNRPELEEQELREGLRLYRAARQVDLRDALILESWRAHLTRQGDYKGAERFALERLQACEKLLGSPHLYTAHARMLYARALAYSGNVQQAAVQATMARTTVDKAGPDGMGIRWLAYSSAAFVENIAGLEQEAEQDARVSCGNHYGWNESNDARLAESHLSLGYALRRQGRFDEAARELEHSASIYAAAGAPFAKRWAEAKAQLDMARRSDASVYAEYMR